MVPRISYDLTDSLYLLNLNSSMRRPQFHFLPESNWMNDPNAPFYDSSTGLYHLFYQFLTPRTWGHAVSENLVDWSILPMALNYSDSLYTEMPNSTAGVYSGSALLMTLASGQVIPWLSISVPTNDMQLLAYPADISDPYFTEWTYSESNPVIYSSSPSDATPPGRDPTEAWPCGLSGENKWCLTYATQQSEGCPCSGVSGSMVIPKLKHKLNLFITHLYIIYCVHILCAPSIPAGLLCSLRCC